jgi:hypothetical protein
VEAYKHPSHVNLGFPHTNTTISRDNFLLGEFPSEGAKIQKLKTKTHL